MTTLQDRTEEGQPSSVKVSKSPQLCLVGFGLISACSVYPNPKLVTIHTDVKPVVLLIEKWNKHYVSKLSGIVTQLLIICEYQWIANYLLMIWLLHNDIIEAVCRKTSSIFMVITRSHITCSVCSAARLHRSLHAGAWSETSGFLPRWLISHKLSLSCSSHILHIYWSTVYNICIKFFVRKYNLHTKQLQSVFCIHRFTSS